MIGVSFEVVERPGEGLAVIRVTSSFRALARGRLSDTALWSRVKVRSAVKCESTGVLIPKGGQAYRPVGNQSYRSWRLSPQAVEA